MANSSSPLPAGYQLVTTNHQYRIDSLMGAGAFGNAYACTNLKDFKPYERLTNSPHRNFVVRSGSPLVIKELFPKKCVHRGAGNDPYAVEANGTAADVREWNRLQHHFLQEALTLWNLNAEANKNIVPVYQMGVMPNGITFFVMPFIGHDNLSSRIGTLPPVELLTHLRKALGALDVVHRRGILHRDIKPQNIILDRADEPVLIDFGMACQSDSSAPATTTYTVSGQAHQLNKDVLNGGTVGYMPWEQLRSSGGTPGPWTDIYALGATFHELITRVKPPDHTRRTPLEPGDPYMPLSRQPALVAVYGQQLLLSIDRALCIQPAQRWQSAREWLAALQNAQIPVGTPPPLPQPTPPVQPTPSVVQPAPPRVQTAHIPLPAQTAHIPVPVQPVQPRQSNVLTIVLLAFIVILLALIAFILPLAF